MYLQTDVCADTSVSMQRLCCLKILPSPTLPLSFYFFYLKIVHGLSHSETAWCFFQYTNFHLLPVGCKKLLASSISLWLAHCSFYHHAMKCFIFMEINCQIWKNTFLILHRRYSLCPGFFTWWSGYQLDFSHKCTEFADCSLVSSEYLSCHKLFSKLGMI